MGLKALARRFGVSGNPVGNHVVHLELDKKIFGAGTADSNALKPEEDPPE